MDVRRWRTLRSAAAFIGIGALSVVLAACNESLDGSAGCPLVCSNVSPQIQTITLNAITVDAAVPADLGLGSETRMLLSSQGDTLDTRVIVRFDSLPTVAIGKTGVDSPIVSVDSVYLRLLFDSLAIGATVPVTVSAYDVDTSATNDTAVAVLAPLFTPTRFISSKTFAPGTLVDTASIALPNSFVLGKILARKRLRIGLRISASQSVSARILSTETLQGPGLTMRVSPGPTFDASIPAVSLTTFSATPVDDKVVSGNISDFTLVVIGTPVPSGPLLAVGGLPVVRTYFQFNLPSLIVDSAIVVRATLVLHQFQVPSVSPNRGDTMFVVPNIVVAGGIVTDPGRAAQIISGTLVTTDTLVTHPEDTGVKEIEIAPMFRVWALQNETTFPRAVVLKSGQENLSPQQALFYSSTAADTLRPQLRISYTRRSRVGTP